MHPCYPKRLFLYCLLQQHPDWKPAQLAYKCHFNEKVRRAI
ncbi:hypothetical protein ccbrp13_13710 [Ktedonobacteria bacterium brp13]|nr:hypothetical protein ccbrp13_13710 [Ktedonobacteria bacterium brp13]